MKVIVYGEKVNIEDKEYENVGEIIDKIESKNCIVSKVIADDKDITSFTAMELEDIKPINKLEIIAKDTEALILESLHEAESYLPRLISGIDNIVSQFSHGNEGEGYKLLEQALEGFQWFNSLVNSFNNLELKKLNLKKDELLEVIEKWRKELKELLAAIENQDIVLISDILEYEMVDILEDYLKMVKIINKEYTN